MNYTQTVTSGTGTLTTKSATGRYLKNGRTVKFSMTITITTNGTGASDIRGTLPFTAANAPAVCQGVEAAINGEVLGASIADSATVVVIKNTTTRIQARTAPSSASAGNTRFNRHNR